jgi:hypothetical protein
MDPSTGRLKRRQLGESGFKTRKAALDAEARLGLKWPAEPTSSHPT